MHMLEFSEPYFSLIHQVFITHHANYHRGTMHEWRTVISRTRRSYARFAYIYN